VVYKNLSSAFEDLITIITKLREDLACGRVIIIVLHSDEPYIASPLGLVPK
jgi:hypothetical protein